MARFPPPPQLRDYRRRRRWRQKAERRKGISSIGRRVAVTVFGYGFRKRRRILFLRKPDKRPFTRVFLAHAPRCHEETERGPLYRGQADLLPRDRYRSLFSFSINDRAPSPRVFSSFSRLSLATIHDDISTRISSERLPLRISTSSYPHPRSVFLFFRRGIFFFDPLRRGCGSTDGQRDVEGGGPKGIRPVYLRIACRLSIQPFSFDPRPRIDTKIRSKSE